MKFIRQGVNRMSNKLFTEAEVEILSRNPYIKNVTTKDITYTDEFKRIFIAENENRKLPSEKELSIEEKYERLKAQNTLLKAENELLKKIDLLERGLRRKK